MGKGGVDGIRLFIKLKAGSSANQSHFCGASLRKVKERLQQVNGENASQLNVVVFFTRTG